jgi:hypothetical protein
MADEDSIAIDKSDWSSDLNYGNLLLRLFLEADVAQQQLDVWNWFNTLNTLFSELSVWCNDEVRANQIIEINRINNAVCLHVKDMNRGRPKAVPNSLYMDLFNYSLFIHKLWKDSGLMSKRSEAPGRNSLK